VQGTDQHEFTGHYSSTALRSVKSFVPRLELHAQIKERLHDTLENRGRSCKILVVCGLGGAGKSQLVLNYVEDFRDDYTATFWIDASSKAKLEADYKQIHNLLLRPTRNDTAIDTCVSEIRQWCHRPNGRNLFILDSADSIDDQGSPEYIDLRKYIVDAPSADVVITTRVQSAKDMTDLDAVQVVELAPDQSREIFIRCLGLENLGLEMQMEIDAVTEELGHFALAVRLAAAHIANTRRLKGHPADYLNEYKEQKTSLLARRPKQHIDQYGESVLTTWETSYAAIASQCPEACNLLTLLSFLSSSNLFPELLGSSYGFSSGILESMICVQKSIMPLQKSIDDGFETLELYSLLQWNKQHDAYSMHKLVHTWAFERLESAEQATFCFATWSYLQHLCWDSRDLPAMEWRLVPHVMACFVKLRALCHVGSLVVEDTVELVSSLAIFLLSAGRLDSAYELQTFSHQHHEQQRFVDPEIYAESLCHLARILGSQGKYDAAEQLTRQALDKLNETLPKEHVWVKELCQRFLAQLLINRDRSYSEAEQMLRCLLDQQRQRNASEIDKSETMIILADALLGQERYREAEKLYKQMLNRSKELSDSGRNTTSTQLSRALRYQGKLAEAEEVARRESDYALIHGATDNRAEKALVALGKVKLAQKAYAEAATLFGQACDATATPNNHTHMECQISLARALRHLPSHDKALVAYTRAIDNYGRVFGDEHRLTQDSSRELDALRAFLAKKEIWKAECERTSLHIARVLGTRQALANRDAGLSISRRRSASSGGPSRGKIRRLRRRALEAQPHYHTTECAQDGCYYDRRWRPGPFLFTRNL
jgi:tetratricopeptide (TPR) repeat protein